MIIPRPMSPDLVMRVPGGINPTPVPNGTSREESTIETTERRRRDSKMERKKRRKEKKRDERRALGEASAKRSDEGHEPPPLGPRGREWRPAIEPGGEACRDAAGACRLSLVPPAHWVERGSRRATWAEGSREGRREKASSRGLLLTDSPHFLERHGPARRCRLRSGLPARPIFERGREEPARGPGGRSEDTEAAARDRQSRR